MKQLLLPKKKLRKLNNLHLHLYEGGCREVAAFFVSVSLSFVFWGLPRPPAYTGCLSIGYWVLDVSLKARGNYSSFLFAFRHEAVDGMWHECPGLVPHCGRFSPVR